ncbi:prostatic acid phosphatase isoform X1 [Nilaparvata lugens]|uniref:prostatic acid phosphatase isoform X1 n=1 Tax=Nilaparvata lugens TaxID=108931 RepID=UPI00193CF454|nr:prostatic acid phosphatase isoform X1 [Nilaparvata lugens]
MWFAKCMRRNYRRFITMYEIEEFVLCLFVVVSLYGDKSCGFDVNLLSDPVISAANVEAANTESNNVLNPVAKTMTNDGELISTPDVTPWSPLTMNYGNYPPQALPWEQSSSDSLKLVIVVHRHGERTPTRFYKNDPYSNVEKYWPEGLGQLTTGGKSQMYKVGQLLRKRYFKHIPKFSVDTVRVFSSDADRCLMSAGTLLAGMFPPTTDQQWTTDINWQPIPIHTIPQPMDAVNGKAKCPKFEEELSIVEKQIDANLSDSLKDLYNYLTTNSGTKVSTIGGVRKLYSTLKCEEVNGYTLPEWTDAVFPDKMRKIVQLSIATNTWTNLLKRLRGGPLLKEILNNLKSKSSGKAQEKLFFYSIHDTGIVSLYRTLGFEEMILPEYGATFIFELHQIGQEYFVKMFFLAETYSEKFKELKFPYCETLCPLEKLLKATEPVVPENWNQECQVNPI